MQQIKFTKFTDAKKATAKKYNVVNDQLTKGKTGSFTFGNFETISINPKELPDFILSLNPGDFIVQGINPDLASGVCPYEAKRSKETFKFQDDAGILVIDSDALDKFDIYSLFELNNAFNTFEPALANVQKFLITSSSSNIVFNGESTGIRGVHTYIPISSTLNNGDILKTLHVRAVIAGFGYAKITNAGTILIRSLIDEALKTSNQPIFEGGAILASHDLLFQKKEHISIDGILLVPSMIQPLTTGELNKYNQIANHLKRQTQPEADKIREQFIFDKSKTLQASDAANLVRLATKGYLIGDFTIRLPENGQVITVQDIIYNPDKYHDVDCYDPLDDTVLGKSRIYTNLGYPVIHSFAHGEVCYRLYAVSERYKAELQEFVAEFNKTHASVIIGGKHRIMRLTPDSIFNDYEFLPDFEIKKLYLNDLIQTGIKSVKGRQEPIIKDKITAWLEHTDCRKYMNGVVFKPGQEVPATQFNLWRGFAVEPCQLDTKGKVFIKKHIEDILCGGDKNLSEYFYNWMAFTMQKPSSPVRVAMVLRGDKGTGKGIIGHFLASLWGEHSIHISNGLHLTGRFNSHLLNKCFLFSDEAFFSGDKQHEPVLKALITEPVMMVELKGCDGIQMPNYLKVFMATNSDYAIPATKNERRYCVLDVSDSKIGDNKYFKKLAEAAKSEEVKADFLFEMLARDISNWDHTPPETKGLKEQRLYSLGSIGQWLADVLINGKVGVDDDWSCEFGATYLYQQYKNWCCDNHVSRYDIQSQTAFGRYLGKMFGKRKTRDGIVWVLKSLDEAIRAFEHYEKITLNDDVDCNEDILVDAEGNTVSPLQSLFKINDKPIIVNSPESEYTTTDYYAELLSHQTDGDCSDDVEDWSVSRTNDKLNKNIYKCMNNIEN